MKVTFPLFFMATAVTGIMAVAASAHQDPGVDSCREEASSALRASGNSNSPGIRSIHRDTTRALALFRFHRPNDASAAVDSATKRLDGEASVIAPHDRLGLEHALSALRSCVLAATPAALATLSVRTQYIEEHPGRGNTASAGGGVYVRVEGIPIGQTLPDGTLSAQVPSGSINVSAIVPPTTFGSVDVRISPGGLAAATIDLDDTKEPSDETDLVLMEAANGTLRRDTMSLTLQFVTDDHPLVVKDIEEVGMIDSEGTETRDFRPLFAISSAAIVAIDARAVLHALSNSATPVRLSVAARDENGFVHDGLVEFRIQKF
jgi:hypothetical protein